jgi:hypothetical protein
MDIRHGAINVSRQIKNAAECGVFYWKEGWQEISETPCPPAMDAGPWK